MIAKAFCIGIFFLSSYSCSPEILIEFKCSGREFFGFIGKDNFQIFSKRGVLDFGSGDGYLQPLNQMTRQHMNAGPKSAVWMYHPMG
jgi:hypothetical protein